MRVIMDEEVDRASSGGGHEQQWTGPKADGAAPVTNLVAPFVTAARSPLLLEEWVEYNRRRWKVRPERIVLGKCTGTPRLEAVFYRKRCGKIWQPPRTVYLPVAFETSPDTGPHRSYTQWTDLSHELAAHMAT